jgi:hypothetical protein
MFDVYIDLAVVDTENDGVVAAKGGLSGPFAPPRTNHRGTKAREPR